MLILKKMECDNIKDEGQTQRRKKEKRAEIEIYRPGALKKLRESKSQVNENINTNDEINAQEVHKNNNAIIKKNLNKDKISHRKSNYAVDNKQVETSHIKSNYNADSKQDKLSHIKTNYTIDNQQDKESHSKRNYATDSKQDKISHAKTNYAADNKHFKKDFIYKNTATKYWEESSEYQKNKKHDLQNENIEITKHSDQEQFQKNISKTPCEKEDFPNSNQNIRKGKQLYGEKIADMAKNYRQKSPSNKSKSYASDSSCNTHSYNQSNKTNAKGNRHQTQIFSGGNKEEYIGNSSDSQDRKSSSPFDKKKGYAKFQKHEENTNIQSVSPIDKTSAQGNYSQKVHHISRKGQEYNGGNKYQRGMQNHFESDLCSSRIVYNSRNQINIPSSENDQTSILSRSFKDFKIKDANGESDRRRTSNKSGRYNTDHSPILGRRHVKGQDFHNHLTKLVSSTPIKSKVVHRNNLSDLENDHRESSGDTIELNRKSQHSKLGKYSKSGASAQSKINYDNQSASDSTDFNESNESINPMKFIDVSTSDLEESYENIPRTFKNKKSQDIIKGDNVGSRGIIQLPSTSSPVHHGEQKVLFNPNNPSKPFIVNATNRTFNEPMKVRAESSKNNNENISAVSDISETSKIVQATLHNIHRGEMDINYFISSNQLPQEFKRVMDIREHLKMCYRQLLISDIRHCQEKNVELRLWRSLYYVIIEKLREYIAREPTLREGSLAILMGIIEDGQLYIQDLLVQLQDQYSFSIDSSIEQDISNTPNIKNRVKQAVNSCHKLLLSLGDLARYKEMYCSNPNFVIAQKWYLKARHLQPRNGRSYNQLAITSLSMKRPLDGVYYYIRSLTADNPFVSARDSLISIFDDIRKKYELTFTAGRSNSNHPELTNNFVDDKPKEESLREETWIRPDSGTVNQRTLSQSDPEDERNIRINDLMKLPQEQIMKQFLTSYLHCHGMLFSRVGMDCFMDALTNTLDSFLALTKTSARLSISLIVQMVAINIFAIENTKIKDMRLDSGYRPAAQEYALLLAQEMFAKFCEVTIKVLPAKLNYNKQSSDKPRSLSIDDSYNMTTDDPHKLFQEQLGTFIPAIKVWCDWLLYNSRIWNPPAQTHDLPAGPDCWSLVAEFATLMKGIGEPDVDLSSESTATNKTIIYLQEDNLLKGYSLLNSSKPDYAYIDSYCSIERARDWVRVNKITMCLTQFLCGVEPPVLRMQKTDQGEVLVPVIAPDLPRQMSTSSINAENPDEEITTDGETQSDIDLDEASFNDDEAPLSGMSSAVKILAKRKKILEKRQKQQRRLQAMMEGSVTLQMEVRPRVLVPDTNCFIQHLHIIQKLVNKSEYEIMVPLIVIDELEGLSKETAIEKYGGDVAHAINVREGAASALHYLRATIGQKSSVKCVTSQGSILTSATFTDEIIDDQDMTNDDRILSCCIHFFKDNNVRRPIEEGVRRLYREVVLLTEDRNLRVKAHARDLPVRNLIDFAHWAGIK